MMDVLERAKDIHYSSRTRHGTDTVPRTQHLRAALAELIEALPERKVPGHLQDTLAPYLDDRVFNIIQLIYQEKPMEQQVKDSAFARIAMLDRKSTRLHASHYYPSRLPPSAC